ncbi:MAG TPA: RDD family protein [Gaiellaceae bacterium]|nr:RDD family protein [Gaiellaceae bacterium]
MRLDRLALGPAERALDALLAGPLPEALGRSLAEHHVIERVAAGMVDEEGAGTSPALEELAHRLVDSPGFRRALEEVLSLPEVRTALTSQATGFGDEVADAVRRRSRALDQLLAARARRLLRLKPAGEAAAFGGFATRGAGLVVDAALAQLGYLVAAASIALVLGLAGQLGPNWLDASLAGGGWFLVMAAYFVVFWSTTGQTPGMRGLGVRVVAPSGEPPSPLRSLVRFVGLILAIIPLFAGFLPALVDGRRRALQDFLAGTVVLDELG